ncbi:hypothetical protein GS455_12545 [Rhodococcus hoagii]|nr:hypothetical protein [Prescottella equi]
MTEMIGFASEVTDSSGISAGHCLTLFGDLAHLVAGDQGDDTAVVEGGESAGVDLLERGHVRGHRGHQQRLGDADVGPQTRRHVGVEVDSSTPAVRKSSGRSFSVHRVRAVLNVCAAASLMGVELALSMM